MEKRLFGTDGIRGPVGIAPITPQFAIKLGWAIGQTLLEHKESIPTALIAKDTRLSGYMLESAIESGLLASGVNTQRLGILPTPGLACLTYTQKADIGIMITASHNSHTDNGFKLFSKKGTKLSEAIQMNITQKLRRTLQITRPKALGKLINVKDAQSRYLKFCKNTVPASFSLKGKKIILDCANGATYQIAPKLFKSLEAEVIVIKNRPTGTNINLNCGSTQPKSLQRRVLKERADIGIAFDGDGDRVIMLDHTGTICDGDDLLFILAKDQHNTDPTQNHSIVGTVLSNQGLQDALSERGINFVRTPVGDRHVYDALQKTNGIFAGEPSGHIICKAFTSTADGLITALQVLVALKGTSLHEARADLYKRPQHTIAVPTSNAKAILKSSNIQQAIKTAQNTIEATQGRLLVRASGTEPLIRVMTEGTCLTTIQRIAEGLAKKLNTVIKAT